jgi:hypothetical protein
MGGNTSEAEARQAKGDRAAMEPPGYGRKHGSRDLRGLTCGDGPRCERLP